MNRPLFNTAWMRFQEINRSNDFIGRKIGGNVGLNLGSGAIDNPAAVRLSFVLNRSGLRIPRIANRTISGADGGWYFTRVHDLAAYLERRFGAAEFSSTPLRLRDLARRRGLLVLELPGLAEGGQATLWNGNSAAGEIDLSQARRAQLWQLA